MLKFKKIKLGNKTLEGISYELGKKKLVIIKGKRGYIMCGYLNLEVAEKLKEVAIKIVGVSNLKEAMGSKVFELTSYARKLGIYKGQSIKEVIKLIV